jgi:hypothetical protein
VHLDAGHSRAVLPVQAPDPSAHTFAIRIVASHVVPMRIRLITQPGLSLHVLDPATIRDHCQGATQQLRCLLRFEALEAEPPGAWRLTVMKPAGPPVDVATTIHFMPINE